MDRFRYQSKTKLEHSRKWCSVSIHRALQWPRTSDSDNNSKRNHRNKHNRYNFNLQSIGSSVLSAISLLTITTPVLANTDVGGVSATANPVANSSGSVTNQAIQVLQGPYITNTYGNGIQCQGATANITPYITRTGSWSDPYESIFQDPVYDLSTDADGNLINPGGVLYYVPTRTGQKSNQNINLGFSATISIPLDKQLQKQCKEAAAANIKLMQQTHANKRLDFEIARLKNCGQLKIEGIVFHPKSPYYSVCSDVVLVNPPGVVGKHVHEVKSTSSKEVDLSIGDTD